MNKLIRLVNSNLFTTFLTFHRIIIKKTSKRKEKNKRRGEKKRNYPFISNHHSNFPFHISSDLTNTEDLHTSNILTLMLVNTCTSMKYTFFTCLFRISIFTLYTLFLCIFYTDHKLKCRAYPDTTKPYTSD